MSESDSDSRPRWQHYKGGLYREIVRGRIEETTVPCVVYQSELDGEVWVRPTDEFEDLLLDGTPRFRLLPP